VSTTRSLVLRCAGRIDFLSVSRGGSKHWATKTQQYKQCARKIPQDSKKKIHSPPFFILLVSSAAA
jgi:hypothetical protein